MYLDSGHGAGQPRKYKNPKKMSTLIDGDLVDALDEIRWREHKSFNEMVNKAISEYIKSHLEGNETFKLDTWQDNPDFKAIPTISASKEKWQQYIAECNNEELTQLGIQSGYIRGLVDMRRSKEARERTKK